MVQMQKHTSLDEPLSGRFYKTLNAGYSSHHSTTVAEETVVTAKSASVPSVLSPAKRVTLRTTIRKVVPTDGKGRDNKRAV